MAAGDYGRQVAASPVLATASCGLSSAGRPDQVTWPGWAGTRRAGIGQLPGASAELIVAR